MPFSTWVEYSYSAQVSISCTKPPILEHYLILETATIIAACPAPENSTFLTSQIGSLNLSMLLHQCTGWGDQQEWENHQLLRHVPSNSRILGASVLHSFSLSINTITLGVCSPPLLTSLLPRFLIIESLLMREFPRTKMLLTRNYHLNLNRSLLDHSTEEAEKENTTKRNFHRWVRRVYGWGCASRNHRDVSPGWIQEYPWTSRLSTTVVHMAIRERYSDTCQCSGWPVQQTGNSMSDSNLSWMLYLDQGNGHVHHCFPNSMLFMFISWVRFRRGLFYLLGFFFSLLCPLVLRLQKSVQLLPFLLVYSGPPSLR